LNSAPESYELLIDTGTAEREKFLDQLEELFVDFRDERTSSINRTYRVVKSMQNWIRSLPNYTKKFTIYLKDGKQKEILPATAFIRRELLKFEINSRELLFDTFVKKLGEDNNGIVGCYQQIYHTKQTLGGHLSDVRQELSKVLIGIFKPGYQGGLSRSIKAWYKDLPAITKTRVFDSNSNILLSFAEKLNSYDDIQVLDELIYRFTSMAIEDWSDALAAQFIDDISASVSKVLSYHQQDHFVQNDDCKIIINLENGNIEKSFVSSKISALGKTALNNLEAVFEEYNGALEPDEQLNILIQMIKDLLE